MFIIKFKSNEKEVAIENIPIEKRKIRFKDFLALTIAAIQVLLPIFCAIFAVFVLLSFLIMHFWLR